MRARADGTVGGPLGWETEVVRLLAAGQRADGRFQNPSPVMKEDDPILCTALAVRALAAAGASD